MARQDLLVGFVTACFCLLLLIRAQWFLDNTRKGQRLIRWFGPDHALGVLRGLALAGIVFGALLSAGIIQPIRW